MGYVLALTGSQTINEYALSKLKSSFGDEGSFRLISDEEMRNPDVNPKEGLFSPTDDYINISEVVRDFPEIHEISITSDEHYQEIIDAIRKEVKSIPIFIKDLNNEINIIPASHDEIKVETGYKLMYLGKKLSF